jgi:hypothetical protein
MLGLWIGLIIQFSSRSNFGRNEAGPEEVTLCCKLKGWQHVQVKILEVQHTWAHLTLYLHRKHPASSQATLPRSGKGFRYEALRTY